MGGKIYKYVTECKFSTHLTNTLFHRLYKTKHIFVLSSLLTYPEKRVMEISLIADRFPGSFLLNSFEDLRAIILVSDQIMMHILDFVSILKS